MRLVVTGLKETWGKEDELLFLGNWCINKSSMEYLKGRKYGVVPFVWSNQELISGAQKFCMEFYGSAIKTLTPALNEIFNENHSERYWKVLIGPWLRYYIQIIYDRYCHIKRAFGDYKGLTVMGLAEEDFKRTYDWYDFTFSMEKDFLNLQFYTQILRHLGIEYVKIGAAELPQGLKRTYTPGQNPSKLKGMLWRLQNMIFNCLGGKGEVLLCSSFNNKAHEYLLGLKSRMKVVSMPSSNGQPRPFVDLTVSAHLRSALMRINFPCLNTEFSGLFKDTFAFNFPLVYLEGYKQRIKELNAVMPSFKNTKLVFSSYGWKSDEKFKLIAAQLMEKGCKLVGGQHGGNSGIAANCPMERHIVDIVDHYFVLGRWGDFIPKIYPNSIGVPGPDFHELAKREYRFSGSKDMILFLGTAMPRYLGHFRYGPIGPQFLEYIQWQKDFIKELPAGLRKFLLMRLPDRTWESMEKISGEFPDIAFDDFSVRFEKVLHEGRLAVIDNINTTFTQALIINCPVVVFYDPKLWVMTEQSRPYLNRLVEAGIIYYSPKEGAKKVAEVYDDVEKWWKSGKVQDARRQFLDMYVLRESSWTSHWIEKFQMSYPVGHESGVKGIKAF